MANSLLFAARPSAAALFAQRPAVGDFNMWLAIIVVLAVVVAFSFVMLLLKQYKRCPSNRVLVIFGKSGVRHEAATCIHGGAKFVVPLIQDYAWLTLEPMQIEIPLRGALSMENIRVNVPSVFTVAIGTAPELMQNAAIRLLGLNRVQVSKQAEDMIFGQLRQVIASMQIEDINRDRDKFLEAVQNSLEPELRKIGLVLINVNITDITDESGYIEAIGQKAASQAIQKARGDVADNERMGEVRVAEAEREKSVSVANAHKVREIGTRDAMREQAVRVAELEKEQKIGEQTAAYQRDAEVKAAERDMRIKLAQADAAAVEGENLSKADIAASQAGLQVKKAEAYELGESRKVRAEAAVLEAEHLARAKAALAERSGSRPNAAPRWRPPPRLSGPASRSTPPLRPPNAASRPRAKRPPSSPGWKPKHAASMKSWPRRAKVCNASSTPVAARSRHSRCSCSNTSTIWSTRRPRPSRTSSSTRSWCGRAALRTARAPRQTGCTTWLAPCRQ